MADAITSFLTPKRTILIYSIFKYFYTISAGFLILATISYALVGRFPTAIGIIPSAIISGIIAYGLFKQRPWVSLVITVLAAIGIITNVLRVPAEPISAIIIIMILAFELYFFNSKDVKNKLGIKSNTLL